MNATDDLLKINIADGTLAWTYEAPSSDYDPPIVTDDAVYLFDDSNDDLLKINLSDGTLAWTYNAPTGGMTRLSLLTMPFIYS